MTYFCIKFGLFFPSFAFQPHTKITIKNQAVFGKFSANDLFLERINPNKPIQRTTQFNVPFDEEKQYKIIIRPQKDQSTVDTAVIFLTNC